MLESPEKSNISKHVLTGWYTVRILFTAMSNTNPWEEIMQHQGRWVTTSLYFRDKISFLILWQSGQFTTVAEKQPV